MHTDISKEIEILKSFLAVMANKDMCDFIQKFDTESDEIKLIEALRSDRRTGKENIYRKTLTKVNYAFIRVYI